MGHWVRRAQRARKYHTPGGLLWDVAVAFREPDLLTPAFLACLRPLERRVVRLRLVGYTTREIAAVVGLKPQGVRNLLARLRFLLTRFLRQG
jgi:DNA-directed RNA polymerase specialized sigma24 family protein